MLDAEKLDSNTVIDENIEVSNEEGAVSNEEFNTFVKNTYHHLVNCERKKMGGPSTLEVFCRMDIGLFLKDDGNLGYFVNEVERSLTCGLWTRNLEVDSNLLARNFSTALVRWTDNLPGLSC